MFSAAVDEKIKEVCAQINECYDIEFLQIGTDQDHVHFLIQSVPMYSPKQLVQIIKSITARKVLQACPEVKKQRGVANFGAMATLSARLVRMVMKK